MDASQPKLDDVFALYQKWGYVQYEGEPVTQQEHALQAAQQALDSNASTSVILGALLHDIGHLISMNARTEEQWSLKNHGEVGKQFLSKCGFPNDVTDLVAGHVNAKRYLIFKHSDYYDKLSSHSRYTLTLQGGAMDLNEAEEFENNPNFTDIIRVREWDEKAKNPNMTTNDMSYFWNLCKSYLNGFK